MAMEPSASATTAVRDAHTAGRVGSLGSTLAGRAGASVSRAEMGKAVDTIARTRNFFSRYGIDETMGNGAIAVQFDPRYSNAAYVHGNRGGELIKVGNDAMTGRSYANADDVIAHEYTHRVVNNILGLRSVGESGAVNESLADTFAAAIDTDDWTIGEDVVPGGMRSMADPGRPQDAIETQFGTTPLPAHVDDYIHTRDDKGGVHLNAGIPNKAAYLIGSQLGREKMADIYMMGIANHMTPRSGIADTARATLLAATELYGSDSHEPIAVRDAWNAVGIDFRP